MEIGRQNIRNDIYPETGILDARLAFLVRDSFLQSAVWRLYPELGRMGAIISFAVYLNPEIGNELIAGAIEKYHYGVEATGCHIAFKDYKGGHGVLEYLGFINSFHLLPTGFPSEGGLPIRNKISKILSGGQPSRLNLLKGDPANGILAALTAIKDYIAGNQVVGDKLSDQVAGEQAARMNLLKGDPENGILAALTAIKDYIAGNQVVGDKLSDQVAGEQAARMNLLKGDPANGILAALTAIKDYIAGNQVVGDKLSDQETGEQAARMNLLKGDPANGILAALTAIKDYIAGSQVVGDKLSDQETGEQAARMNLLKGDPANGILAALTAIKDYIAGSQVVGDKLSDQVAGEQAARMNLLKGDPANGILAALTAIKDYIAGSQVVGDKLSDQETGEQAARMNLLKGDPANGILAALTAIKDYIAGSQVVGDKLSDQETGEQAARMNLLKGDPAAGILTALFSMYDWMAGSQLIRSSLSNKEVSSINLRNAISEKIESGIRSIVQQILEKDSGQGIQAVLADLRDLETRFVSVSREIYLDGRPIFGKITSCKISYDESKWHNEITITSIDRNLFFTADPEQMKGELRIEAQVGGQTIQFLLEKRTGDEKTFVLWGRDATARENSPIAEEIKFVLDSPKMASEIAGDLMNYTAIDWEIIDWMVPAGFEFTGPPIEGVAQLAGKVKAIIRAQDDGSIKVRRKHIKSPADHWKTVPDISFDREGVIQISQDAAFGDGTNQVTVNGYSPSAYIPDIEVEESSPEIGTDVHLRVFWAGKRPDIVDLFVTAGRIGSYGIIRNTITEFIDFKNGTASAQYPVNSITSIQWIGSDGGEIQIDPYGKNLKIENEAFRTAKISYLTEYERLIVNGGIVERLLAVLMFSAGPDVSMLVSADDVDIVRDAQINEPMLTTQAAAIEAAKAFIIDNKYDWDIINLAVPFQFGVKDGDLAELRNEKINISGNGEITAVTISMAGAQTIHEITVRKCRL